MLHKLIRFTATGTEQLNLLQRVPVEDCIIYLRRVTFAFVWTLQTVCVRSYIFWSECDGDQGIKLTLTWETKQ